MDIFNHVLQITETKGKEEQWKLIKELQEVIDNAQSIVTYLKFLLEKEGSNDLPEQKK